VLACRCRLCEARRAAAQHQVGTGIEQLFGDRAGAAIFQRVLRTECARHGRRVAFALHDIGYLRAARCVLDFSGRDIAGGQPSRFGALD